MLNPGDVVTTYFPGADADKRRPSIVVSTSLYHANRPDAIVAVVTTRLTRAITPTDYIIQEWAAAGLRQPSAFRAYLVTFEQSDVHHISRLSERDWMGVQNCLARAIAGNGNVAP
jgi:mRNA interferase MazF